MDPLSEDEVEGESEDRPDILAIRPKERVDGFPFRERGVRLLPSKSKLVTERCIDR